MSIIIYQARNKGMDKIVERNIEELIFVEDVQQGNIDVNNLKAQRDKKETFLRNYLGYESFKYKNEDNEVENIPLERWRDGKINVVFKSAYYSALKRLGKAFS